jgi:hypothetical protein
MDVVLGLEQRPLDDVLITFQMCEDQGLLYYTSVDNSQEKGAIDVSV